jgi:hypothetical protein
MLVMYSGIGVLMAAIAAFALGRLTVRGVRDVELAQAAEPEARRDDDCVRGDEERFRREPVPDREPVRTAAATSAPAPAPVTREPVETPDPEPREPAEDDTSVMDTTRPIPPATPPAVQPTRRSGGLLGRLRRS